MISPKHKLKHHFWLSPRSHNHSYERDKKNVKVEILFGTIQGIKTKVAAKINMEKVTKNHKRKKGLKKKGHKEMISTSFFHVESTMYSFMHQISLSLNALPPG